MVKAASYLTLLSLVLLPMLQGCDTTSTQTLQQSVLAMAWLPDESGLLGLVQRISVSQTDNTTITTTDLYRINLDGSLGDKIQTPDENYIQGGYAPFVFVSPDGKFAITQLISSNGSPEVYRIDIQSGSATNIIPNTNLVGVSRDGKYVITTNYQPDNQTKPLKFYDISVSPIRLVVSAQPTITGMLPQPLLWLDSNRFAVTRKDSIGYNVSIRDSSGAIYRTIADAGVPVHGGAYSIQTHELFFVTNETTIQKLNLATDERTIVLPQSDSTESFDVSTDGTLIVYSSGGISNPFQLRAHNVANGHEAVIASDANEPVLSPRGDRVAYVNSLGETAHVAAVTLPQ